MLNTAGAETLFPVGTNTIYAPVWITNSGPADEIGVNLVEDNTAAPQGGRVKAKWNISENTEGGGNYTLRFGWLPPLEDAAFRANRAGNAGIFLLGSDTTEAGTGNYTTQFAEPPYWISRGGITTLGSFAVGKFGTITDVKEEQNIPFRYRLSQNYPNPFNPVTSMQYTIGSRQFVTLKIYNVLGKEVATLVNEEKPAGKYKIVFDASGLSSGVYFYTLHAGSFVQTKKLMVLK